VKTVIIVEDDPFSQEFYKYLLKREKYVPLVVEDGNILLEKLKGETISLIIMDINLKNSYLNGEKVDGVVLSKMIKENPEFAKIPILLVTAYSLNADGPAFFKDSLAEDYIAKPIMDYNFLLEKINKLIKN
jgi:two-component system, cell cycle response regulator DivK